MVEILFMRMFAFFQLHPVAEPIATSISEDGKKLLARAFVVVFLLIPKSPYRNSFSLGLSVGTLTPSCAEGPGGLE